MKNVDFFAPSPWKSITASIKAAKSSHAVTAYLGTGAFAMLSLKRGDRLIVDASSGNVKAGLTNPFEIEKAYMAGVRCYSVAGLHAKVYVAGDAVYVGSANASIASRDVLFEACIQVRDRILAREAIAWIDTLPLTPLGKPELASLKSQYNAPKIGSRHNRERVTRPRQASSWVVSVCHEDETDDAERFALEVSKRNDVNREDVYSISWTGSPPKVYSEALAGDEVFVINALDNYRVYGPMRLYERPVKRTVRGKTTYYLALEDTEKYITFLQLCKAASRGGTAIAKSGNCNKQLKPEAALMIRNKIAAKSV